MPPQPEGKWHSIVDKNSGRTYYYNDVSKKTTWDKPAQLMTAEEAATADRERRLRREFFDEMEKSILDKINGLKLPPSPRPDRMEELMILDEKQRSGSIDSGETTTRVISRPRTISTIDREMNSYMKRQADQQAAAAAAVAAGPGTGTSPLTREMTLSSIQAKDDCSAEYSRTRSSAGQWKGMAAGLLDPGAEAKHAAIRGYDEKRGSFMGGVSIMGTSPSEHGGDFDFLREIDYLKAGQKAAGKSPRASVNGRTDTSSGNKPSVKRRNSTSTLFVSSTMQQQDNEATIRCVAVVIRAHMRSSNRDMTLPNQTYDVFLDAAYRDEFVSDDEDVHGQGRLSLRAESKSDGATALPVAQSKLVFGERSVGRIRSGSNSGRRTMSIPSVDEIESFLLDIFRKSQLEGECIIMSLIYCERLVKQTKGALAIRYDNWRSITFACLVMASKVWDDLSMWNADFSNVCSSFDLQRVNDLERTMLEILSYRIKVSASEYAKYYFHLRAMMARLSLNRTNSSAPLDLRSARKLQLATEGLQERFAFSAEGTTPAGRGRCTTTIAAPNSLDRADIIANRAASMENGISPLVKGIFLGVDDLMHSSHTNADGTDRTAEKLKAAQKEAKEVALQAKKTR